MISHHLFGIRVDDASHDETENLLRRWCEEQQPRTIFTPNPEMIMKTFEDSSFGDILNQSDLSLYDGVGLKFAIAALTDGYLKHRQTGVDTLVVLAQICEVTQKRLLLLGGASSTAKLAATKLNQQFPALQVFALDPGIVLDDLSVSLLEEVKKHSPTVIAVGLGAGKQERVVLQLKQLIPSMKIGIGVGGAFDSLSGNKKRAPACMRRVGFEWLWRLLIEPKRFHRIIRATILFPFAVIIETLKQRRFWRGCMRVLSGGGRG